MRLAVLQPRADYVRKSFSYSSAALWNSLLTDIRVAKTLGEKIHSDSALPLLNLLDLLTVENIFIFRLLQFSHQWHEKKLPSIFDNYFRYASDVHAYNTRYASKSNFYKARFRTNIGKTTLLALAADYWQKLPHDIKNLNTSIFPRKAKQYLLRKQM